MISDSVRQYATSNNLPCTSLVASFVFDRLGYTPKNITDTDSWYNLNPDLWADISLWGSADQLGSFGNIDAIKKVLNGTIVSSNDDLIDGQYVVQRWCGNRGHVFLLFVDKGQKYIIDSSTVKGLTIKQVDNWILDGCEHAIVRIQKKTLSPKWLIPVCMLGLYWMVK